MRDQLPIAAVSAAAADTAQSDLIEAYASGPAKSHEVAALHQRINFNLKRAEVAALIAIGQRLDDLTVTR